MEENVGDILVRILDLRGRLLRESEVNIHVLDEAVRIYGLPSELKIETHERVMHSRGASNFDFVSCELV